MKVIPAVLGKQMKQVIKIQKESQKEQNMRHTFSISDSRGNKKQGLKKSFLVVETLSVLDNVFKTKRDGIEWPIHKEQALQDLFKKQPEVKCILSFQSFEDGEHFCVARVWKEKQKKQPQAANQAAIDGPQEKAA